MQNMAISDPSFLLTLSFAKLRLKRPTPQSLLCDVIYEWPPQQIANQITFEHETGLTESIVQDTCFLFCKKKFVSSRPTDISSLFSTMVRFGLICAKLKCCQSDFVDVISVVAFTSTAFTLLALLGDNDICTFTFMKQE